MKKIMILVLGLFLVFGMSGCFENPTAPATVYDPTPTPEESVTPEETVGVTPTGTKYVITVTGDHEGTFTICYKAADGTSTGVYPCSDNGTLESGFGYVWTSIPVYGNGIATYIKNTTDQVITLRVYRNDVLLPDPIDIPVGDFNGQTF